MVTSIPCMLYSRILYLEMYFHGVLFFVILHICFVDSAWTFGKIIYAKQFKGSHEKRQEIGWHRIICRIILIGSNVTILSCVMCFDCQHHYFFLYFSFYCHFVSCLHLRMESVLCFCYFSSHCGKTRKVRFYTVLWYAEVKCTYGIVLFIEI